MIAWGWLVHGGAGLFSWVWWFYVVVRVFCRVIWSFRGFLGEMFRCFVVFSDWLEYLWLQSGCVPPDFGLFSG